MGLGSNNTSGDMELIKNTGLGGLILYIRKIALIFYFLTLLREIHMEANICFTLKNSTKLLKLFKFI